jgi:hypothetical protein
VDTSGTQGPPQDCGKPGTPGNSEDYVGIQRISPGHRETRVRPRKPGDPLGIQRTPWEPRDPPQDRGKSQEPRDPPKGPLKPGPPPQPSPFGSHSVINLSPGFPKCTNRQNYESRSSRATSVLQRIGLITIVLKGRIPSISIFFFIIPRLVE